jgi:bla regulator protein BlaR1
MMDELSWLAKATVVLAAALGASRAAAAAPAAVRALMLAAAFAMLLILPLAAVAIPTRTIAIPVPPPAQTMPVDDTSAAFTERASPDTTRRTAATSAWVLPSLPTALRAVWLAGVALFFSSLALSLWRLRRAARSGRRWIAGDALVDAEAARIGAHRRVELFLHDDLPAPMTFGLWRPTIGLPADAPRWSPPDLQRALVHELEHVRRRDWLLHLMARVTCGLYWFHPLAWVAWRRLHVETERACDDAVLREADATAYAEQLVSLARRVAERWPSPVLSMASRSELGARVAAILDSRPTRGRASSLCTAAIVAVAAALVAAISPLQAVHRLAEPQTTAPGTRRPAFDVVSIKPNVSSVPNQTITRAGNTFVARNVTLPQLIFEAYRVDSDQLSGADGWMASERYDVEAKPAAAADWNEQMLMLQSLLADRFQLKLRRETRNVPAYSLLVAGAGVKLRPAAGGDCPSVEPCGAFRNRPGVVEGRRVSVAQLASILSGPRSGRPVVDATGIRGVFDFDLRWTPDPGQLPPGPAPDDAPPFDPSGPSLFTALEEQLGLRLQPTTAMVEHFTIEQAERPLPNDGAAAPQGAPAAAAFDVASVRLNTSGAIGARQQFTEGRFTATNTTLQLLIQDAYRIQVFQVIGGPEWLTTARFDIVATVPPGTSPEQRPPLLRALLAERFNLGAHMERRDLPVFSLVPAGADKRFGPNFRTSSLACDAVSAGGALRAPVTTVQADGRPVCGMTMGPAAMRGGGVSMLQLANALAQFARRPVIDRTGLSGFFDFDLRYAPAGRGGAPPPASDERPSIFTAVREQLGLALEPAIGPVDVLVIDRADMPSGN